MHPGSTGTEQHRRKTTDDLAEESFQKTLQRTKRVFTALIILAFSFITYLMMDAIEMKNDNPLTTVEASLTTEKAAIAQALQNSQASPAFETITDKNTQVVNCREAGAYAENQAKANDKIERGAQLFTCDLYAGARGQRISAEYFAATRASREANFISRHWKPNHIMFKHWINRESIEVSQDNRSRSHYRERTKPQDREGEMQNSEPAANGIQGEGSPGANPIPKQENSRDDKVAEIVGSIMLILPFFLLAIPFNLALDHSGTAAYAAFEEDRGEVTRQLEIATGSKPETVTNIQQQCSYFTSREGKRRRGDVPLRPANRPGHLDPNVRRTRPHPEGNNPHHLPGPLR